MQLNGTISGYINNMAASEPPEPPPRNPDKINASLKHLAETKQNAKSLDTADRTTLNNNNKLFRPILSLDTPSTSAPVCQGSTTIVTSHSSNQITIKPTNEMNSIENDQKFTAIDNGLNHGDENNDKDNTGCLVMQGNDNQKSPSTASSQSMIIKLNETLSDNSSDGNLIFKNGIPDLESPQTSKLRLENEKLTAEIGRLRKILENSPDGAIGGIELSDSNSCDAQDTTDCGTNRLERLEAELKLAKEQITALKMEKKKLKGDKSDLLAHVKQLCSSLQEKEQELRDFIRNYEQRIRESENNAAKLTSDRERERWSLLKHARDEAERSLALAAQLNARDVQLQRVQEQLQEARRQLTGCLSDQDSLISMPPLTPPSGLMGHMSGGQNLPYIPNANSVDRVTCCTDSNIRGPCDREIAVAELSDGTCDNGPSITVDPDSISLVSSHHMYQFGTPKERSPTLSPLNTGTFSRSTDNATMSSRSVEQLGSPVEPEAAPLNRRIHTKTTISSLTGKTGRGGTWGSISRVFARSRHRSKNTQSESEVTDFHWNPLTEEGYAEKLRLLREASSVPMERWRASQILAWLEVALGMPQYSSRCSENVKSGKVLLELSDAELENGLGLSHPMHRKKLRLAIEEHRRPDLVRYPTIGQLGHTWVASEWLPDIGLPQYVEAFLHSLVDARMLDTLSKKELEKFLSVTRKFHQASVVHGIHVLRILKYDRQALAIRRLQCDNVDADPIVWTNQRFIRWAKSIDLGEYAENLKESGVHGGLVVLEPSFTGDTMATALGIPPSKNIIRRHLATEFEAVILPARANLGQGIRSGGYVVPITGPDGLQSASVERRLSNSNNMRFGWKGSQGSLYKAFRFNRAQRSDKNSTSPTPSYSSSEGGIYSTIGFTAQHQHLPPPTTAPPPPPPSHRASAPPMERVDNSILLPKCNQHRRVKSISDIEVVAATPV